MVLRLRDYASTLERNALATAAKLRELVPPEARAETPALTDLDRDRPGR
jgi:hypothetical protein